MKAIPAKYHNNHVYRFSWKAPLKISIKSSIEIQPSLKLFMQKQNILKNIDAKYH